MTGSHFFPKSTTDFFFALLKPRRRPAGRLSQVSIWNRRTPPLSSRRRPGHSKNTLPSSPPHRRISADATPVTARRRRRQRTSADTKTAADRRPVNTATAPVTEGEYAVNTSTENTSPPSASRPLPQTPVCRHQHRAYWNRQTAHVQTATSSPRSREADMHTTAESWHQNNEG